MKKCKFCDDEAIWAMQFISERKPSFYAFGWHIRGFGITNTCDRCFNIIINAWEKLGEQGNNKFEIFLEGLGL